jgi:hypothetical protein
VRLPWKGDEGGEKRIRDEPNGVVIHICMETSQRHSLHSYLYLKLAKNIKVFILSFIFYKIGQLEGRTCCA